MKKQARLLQEQFELAKTELKTKQFTGSSGNGLVSLVLNGEKELLSIKIKPECVDLNDLEGLEDLIKAAHDAASEQAAQNDPLNQMPGSLPML